MPPNTFSLTKRYSNLANELGARASEQWAVVRCALFTGTRFYVPWAMGHGGWGMLEGAEPGLP